MGTAATRAKTRYNDKAYKQYAVRVKPDLFDRIDLYCKNNNLSKSQFLEMAIKKLEEEQ